MKNLPPEIQKIIDEQPAAVVVGMVLLGMMLMDAPKKGTVAGLGGRRNGAWRGKGSFGKAPFGKQMGHKR